MQLPMQITAQCSRSSLPIALYNSKQVYAIEQAWFAQGYDSFGLMQQAAWQMAQRIILLYQQVKTQAKSKAKHHNHKVSQPSACVWVGQGNNGGDGWLIAHYLQQAGWQVQVITVGIENDNQTNDSQNSKSAISDALKAQRMALDMSCPHQRFEDMHQYQNKNARLDIALQADVYIDALFGIGLDRAPANSYKQAIVSFNSAAQQIGALVVAVDIPSGLVASTGQVFEGLAIQADITLCLIARKFGLHTKDGMGFSGKVIDIPLIPFASIEPAAILLKDGQHLTPRCQNSYKGSYGHVLVVGGNRIDGSQGMGGAAILTSSSAMATGAGKITVACHQAFHGALLSSLPDAMTIDLHEQESVEHLIKSASVVAIGMGLGRDEKAKILFTRYLKAAIAHNKTLIIDADGLYHLAALQRDKNELITQLREYSKTHNVCLTPHSGEAAKLLDKKISAIENDRSSAIHQCANIYGGNWVLKGAGSLILAQGQLYVCGAGNAGMATAGMGDILSGVVAGLLAQQDLNDEQNNLCQAVVIHALAGDMLVRQSSYDATTYDRISGNQLLIGQRGLQAQDMPAAIRHIMQKLTC
ncbi:NAD(P)H-hydrate dehydratase [Psychrobacter sp. FBL11]|uniref:ADP-dependent (S)-NAD(P)H-hydrate dehydratase n=1 Tax=Psychrobacter saeujeotis TaxID=3143436 RepID=A0ABU9XA06_9GAMM|nr:NAD(P)H-hydrate dehydratase [uncultured Psychrobacter sp.]